MPDPTPPAATPSSPDPAQLQRERDEARAVAEQAKREAAEAGERHRQQLEQVAAYLRNREAQAAQPPPEEDNPNAIASRRDVARSHEASTQATRAMLAERDAVLLKNQRAINKQLAAARLKNFDKYAAEIDQHLDRLDPAVAAQPNAYDEVHTYVRAKHFDDELAETLAAREAEAQAARDADAADIAVVARAPGAPVPRIAPVAAGAAARPVARAASAAPSARMTPEERRRAQRMGITEDDWVKHRDADYTDEDVDVVGFYDKETGRMRARV